MSDEAKVLAATVMRSLPSGAYHARRALAALESENAALQEELRKYQPGQGEGWPDDRHEFAGRLTALREVAERLQDERDSLIGDIADSWAPRIEALEEKNRQLELQRASALEEGRKRGKFNRSRNEESRTRLLQERIGELTRANYRMHLLYEITPPEKNALERIDALQERAEKAEARIRAAYQVLGFYDGDEIPPRIRERFLTALPPHPGD